MIEFELPTDEDPHLDATHGARWKRLVHDLQAWLRIHAATGKNRERQLAFDDVRRFIREEMHTAGLTFYPSQQLEELSLQRQNSWMDKLNAYLEKKEFTSESPGAIEPQSKKGRRKKSPAESEADSTREGNRNGAE